MGPNGEYTQEDYDKYLRGEGPPPSDTSAQPKKRNPIGTLVGAGLGGYASNKGYEYLDKTLGETPLPTPPTPTPPTPTAPIQTYSSPIAPGIPAGTASASAPSALDAPVSLAPEAGVMQYPGAASGGPPLALPTETGTPNFAIGEPSYAGYVAGAISGIKGARDYLKAPKYQTDMQTGQNLSHAAGMTAANIYTGGLASLADTAAQKLLGNKYKKVFNFIHNKYTDPITAVSYLTGSKKSKDQLKREMVKDKMKEQGILDENYNYTTANGGKVNWGMDGNAKADYAGGRRPHEVNGDNKFANQAVLMTNPISRILVGGDEKLHVAFTGLFANTVMSDASSIDGVRANTLKLLKDVGLDRQKIEQGIQGMVNEGIVSVHDGLAYVHGMNSLFKKPSGFKITIPPKADLSTLSKGDRIELELPPAAGAPPGTGPAPTTTPQINMPAPKIVVQTQRTPLPPPPSMTTPVFDDTIVKNAINQLRGGT